MTAAPGAAPLLVLAVGNPSRGDDALGPMFVERLGQALAPEVASGAVELLTDFQLQIEHALDLTGRARVVFVDASAAAAPPFELTPAVARRDASISTHAMSPEALLETHRAVVGPPPESWVLAIRGERFELGDPLSQAARAHLEAALDFFVADTRARPDAVLGEPARAAPGTSAGRRLDVAGIVQGVGFRPWVYRTARRLSLTGSVYNTPEGVSIEAFGGAADLEALVRALQNEAPEAARVRSVRTIVLEGPAPDRFVITPSPARAPVGDAGASALALAPDLGLCDACACEVADPTARRHGYAFATCTACGPRLAIARALPFDRATTTMSAFPLCDACAREYADPGDRRFHAQTLACPACGPRVWLAGPDGQPRKVEGDPLDVAAALLRDGQILGVQGLGAFHLVCDATSAAAVAELRRRKRRDAQPFAVMVRDPAMAAALVTLDESSRDALGSSMRPIVLGPSSDSDAAGALAPAVNGPSRRTGVMLPYTPLHAGLVARAERPLVMTSGNPSGGPAVIDHAAAPAVLGPMVDAFLFHDRPIERRVEDSVVAPGAAGLRVLRRSRGLAPTPIRLRLAAREPILAVGGHMKSTACVVVGDHAYLTPHLGDLDLEESVAAWRRDVEGFERLVGVRASTLAHDLHPDYGSTRYALERPAVRRVPVQHHVAHVLAALAELRLDEPVVGVVFDGTGFGTDGTAWGAEILIVDGPRWTRAASFRPLGLPGGEHGIRAVWKVALSALVDAFGAAEALALAARLGVFAAIPPAALGTVVRQLEAGVATVPARGMGRWFDAFGALALGLPRAQFDAHVAIAFEEAAADPSGARPYPVAAPALIASGEAITPAHEIDLRPTVRAAVADLLAGAAPPGVSARFHRTILDATASVVARVLAATGVGRVILSGGSFQNRWLERGLIERLSPARVATAREVPLNDGGLALGQAWAAVLASTPGPSGEGRFAATDR